MQFAFGQSEHERIAVDVLSYERPASGQYHDDNWIVIDITVSAGGFRGRVSATILTGELALFCEQIHTLYDRLAGTAEFSTPEDQLSLKLTANGTGHINLVGAVSDCAGTGNELSFTLDFDQTLLLRSVRELDAVVEAFPVRAPQA